jgi:hypothetical protein
MLINKEFIKKYQIVILLIVVILIMSGLKLKYGYKPDDSEQMTVNREQIEVTPTMTITPTQDPKKDFPLIDKLPYYGNGFVVEKYIAPKTLKMILNGATEKKATDDVIKWIDAFGDAIGEHKVELQNN